MPFLGRFSLLACLLFLGRPDARAEAPASGRGEVAATWSEAFARMKAWSPSAGSAAPAERVDPSSLDGKVMVGYQGWFAAEGDGSGMGWVHWGGKKFGPGNLSVEAWPDMSEAAESEKYPTPFRHADGSTAVVFSSYNPDTVDRHFRWMREYGIHGAFLQRFFVSLRDPRHYDFRTAVTDNVRAAANRHGRTWAMMYDLSGMGAGESELRALMDDWRRLNDLMRITRDPSYQHHRGKPLVAVWGVGFPGREYNPLVPAFIEFLKNDELYGGNAVMIGTPFGWRDGSRDSRPSPELIELCRKADIVSPWAVGRHGSVNGFVSALERYQKADLAWCRAEGVDYLPVIFPGFSWANLMRGRGRDPGRPIPRGDGSFFWRQGSELIQAGARMLYVAMFDEVDEATAIFKISSNPPASDDSWVSNAPHPPDHYLWLAGELARALSAGTAPSSELPRRAP